MFASVSFGIPCALASALLPGSMRLINLAPSKVGLLRFHSSSHIMVLSSIADQDCVASGFSNHAPRIQVSSPSLEMWRLSGMFMSSSFIFLFSLTELLYSSEPKEIISVLFLLNFAPGDRHHLSRILARVAKQSLLDRNTVVSSSPAIFSASHFKD